MNTTTTRPVLNLAAIRCSTEVAQTLDAAKPEHIENCNDGRVACPACEASPLSHKIARCQAIPTVSQETSDAVNAMVAAAPVRQTASNNRFLKAVKARYNTPRPGRPQQPGRPRRGRVPADHLQPRGAGPAAGRVGRPPRPQGPLAGVARAATDHLCTQLVRDGRSQESDGRRPTAGDTVRDRAHGTCMRSTTALAAFASEVLQIARGEDAVLFGERKAFLVTVLEAWHAASPAGRTRQAFTSQLLAAHQAGLLVLARADLVSAMDPELVKWSEVVAPGATFHFVVIQTSSKLTKFSAKAD